MIIMKYKWLQFIVPSVYFNKVDFKKHLTACLAHSKCSTNDGLNESNQPPAFTPKISRCFSMGSSGTQKLPKVFRVGQTPLLGGLWAAEKAPFCRKQLWSHFHLGNFMTRVPTSKAWPHLGLVWVRKPAGSPHLCFPRASFWPKGRKCMWFQSPNYRLSLHVGFGSV